MQKRQVGHGVPEPCVSDESPHYVTPEGQPSGKAKLYPDRDAARKVVLEAVHRGMLRPEPCEEILQVHGEAVRCGRVPTQAHHWSYHPDHWLDVIWLCRKHHDMRRYE